LSLLPRADQMVELHNRKPELLAALDAFLQEHRRFGELDGGVDDVVVWMSSECGAQIVHQAGQPAG
jgi:hypothetical protein